MDHAVQVLQNMEAGRPFGGLVDGLVVGVLAGAATAPSELVRLALEVRDGGPLRTARAVRLALAVIDAVEAAETVTRASR